MKNNIDYDDELLYSLRKLRYYDYCITNKIVPPYFFGEFERNFIKDLVGEDNWQKYQNKCSSISQRKWRLKLRIDYMIRNYNCMFVTFTLNEQSINYQFETLRKTICRILKEMNCYYVGNVDYGSENERLHFHFLVASDNRQIIETKYNYGYYYIEDVYNYNSIKLSNYIDKITNHGLKGTTGKYNIITSRGDYAFTDILKEYRLNERIEKEVSMKENYDIW